MTSRASVTVIGGSGYTGGELLRLLLRHPNVEIAAVTSDVLAGNPVHRAHPNLRKATQLQFVPRADAKEADVVIACTPHGESVKQIDRLLGLGDRLIDLSADFRLKDPASYRRWYGHDHPRPELLERSVYGIAELHRDEIRGATFVSGAGCIATASILALAPLVRAGLVDTRRLLVDAKIGSSASGLETSVASIHAERSGVVRLYAPAGHRHTGEIEQELAVDGARPTVGLTCHAVDMVRGILATGHAFLKEGVTVEDKDLWRIYRQAYGNEPFVRLVRERTGAHRFPEPKFVVGTNYCDVGFEVDPHANRIIVVSAIDNLSRGSASAAVQNLNLMMGWPETAGLGDLGLHPV